MNYYVYPGIRTVSAKHLSKKSRELRMEEGEKIIRVVSDYFGVDCRERRRFSGIIEARQTAYALLRKYTSLSYTDIGRLFGADHTTVLYSISRLNDLIETGDLVKYKYEGCEQYLVNNFI